MDNNAVMYRHILLYRSAGTHPCHTHISSSDISGCMTDYIFIVRTAYLKFHYQILFTFLLAAHHHWYLEPVT